MKLLLFFIEQAAESFIILICDAPFDCISFIIKALQATGELRNQVELFVLVAANAIATFSCPGPKAYRVPTSQCLVFSQRSQRGRGAELFFLSFNMMCQNP